MTEKPQETEKPTGNRRDRQGWKREPVARDDEFPPPEGAQDTVDEEIEWKPSGARPL